MQRPTLNKITQTSHLASKAVDYSASPDWTIYAPEDGTISSYVVAGECGNNLKLRTGDHEHSFCHLETNFVIPGMKVLRGTPIGAMGYTGKTIPAGAGGRHLHHFIRFDNGTYVYPPDLANEAFIKQEGIIEDMKAGLPFVEKEYTAKFGRLPKPGEATQWVGKDAGQVAEALYESAEGYGYRAYIEKVKAIASNVSTEDDEAQIREAMSKIKEAEAKLNEAIDD